MKDIIKCLISDALDPITFRIPLSTLSALEVTPSLRRLRRCHVIVSARKQVARCASREFKSNLVRLTLFSNCIH